MVRVILRRRLDTGLTCLPCRIAIGLTYQGNRLLQFLPRHRMGELLGAEQRARWRAGRHLCIRALRKGTETIFGQKAARHRQETPSEKIAFCDGSLRESANDFKPIRTRVFRLFEAALRLFAGKIHGCPLRQTLFDPTECSIMLRWTATYRGRQPDRLKSGQISDQGLRTPDDRNPLLAEILGLAAMKLHRAKGHVATMMLPASRGVYRSFEAQCRANACNSMS